VTGLGVRYVEQTWQKLPSGSMTPMRKEGVAVAPMQK